jgi:D-alanine-D-alanine ligase
MKIAILTYLESETDKAHDVVVDQIAAALKANGHKVTVVGEHGDARRLIRSLARAKPDLVFNVMEMFGGERELLPRGRERVRHVGQGGGY